VVSKITNTKKYWKNWKKKNEINNKNCKKKKKLYLKKT
jgi:hypothetical protein